MTKRTKKTISRSKWSRTKYLLRHDRLRRYIPYTVRLDKHTLPLMLERFHSVFLKPDAGAFGRGVIKIRKRKAGDTARSSWIVHSGSRVRSFSSFAHMYRFVRARTRLEPYVAQRGIPLLHANGRPVDFRIVVQRNRRNKWIITGMIARIARRGKIVTNGSSGGSVMPVPRMLNQYFTPKETRQITMRLRTLGLLTAQHLAQKNPGMHEIGLDVGLTQKRAMWLIEVNSYPDPVPFMKLKDQRMLRTIVQLGRYHGRSYRLQPKYRQPPV